jgi:hypothetical protein
MVRLLAAAGVAGPASVPQWFESQQRGFRRRSRGAFSVRHAACLKVAYGERIDLLFALAGREVDLWRREHAVISPDAPWR